MRFIMCPAFVDKKNVSGPTRYFYHRCSQLAHKGWNSCSIRQINAERLHDMLYRWIRSIYRRWLASSERPKLRPPPQPESNRPFWKRN
jgi:hypothetical protein